MNSVHYYFTFWFKRNQIFSLKESKMIDPTATLETRESVDGHAGRGHQEYSILFKNNSETPPSGAQTISPSCALSAMAPENASGTSKGADECPCTRGSERVHISPNAYLLFKLHGKFGTSGRQNLWTGRTLRRVTAAGLHHW